LVKDGKKSKTEALFIPGKSNPDPPANSEDYRTGDGYISFTKHFNYLGSYISNDLSDDRDVKNRISTKQAKTSAALRRIFSATKRFHFIYEDVSSLLLP